MKILALEFSSERRSVAVLADGVVRGEAHEIGGRASHAIGLMETTLKVAQLEREQIDCLAVGIGPGSYTGIRAAISVAQGWQLATGIRLLGINSVAGIATHAQALGVRGIVHAVIDAQRDDLYLATYDITADACHEMEPIKLMSLDEARARAGTGGVVIGPEATKWFPDGREIFPDAGVLAGMAALRGDFVSGAQLEPIYLRETSFVKAPPPRILPVG